ncbi:hypothetical protein RND71_025018 [Anisodus tanguticus]|uniref:Uncharacterized protein n=1 Tax=Anisodus tanguticus TaxID=243964 RepID=A0AAE1V5F1_9SOLA|nr:hypothetical protein RND71_025018 [Anisodus tanguticus]
MKGLELGLGLECASAIDQTRAPSSLFLLKEQQGGHPHEELELGLGLGSGDDNMKMEAAIARNYQGFWSQSYTSSSSVILCTNTSKTSIPHHSLPGLWFSLHPSINRKGEVLPQVQKSFIRVKRERDSLHG